MRCPLENQEKIHGTSETFVLDSRSIDVCRSVDHGVAGGRASSRLFTELAGNHSDPDDWIYH
jgi:hypothetical protein